MVRKAEKSDLGILANLAALIWNRSNVDTLFHEFSEIITNKDV